MCFVSFGFKNAAGISVCLAMLCAAYTPLAAEPACQVRVAEGGEAQTVSGTQEGRRSLRASTNGQ